MNHNPISKANFDFVCVFLWNHWGFFLKCRCFKWYPVKKNEAHILTKICHYYRIPKVSSNAHIPDWEILINICTYGSTWTADKIRVWTADKIIEYHIFTYAIRSKYLHHGVSFMTQILFIPNSVNRVTLKIMGEIDSFFSKKTHFQCPVFLIRTSIFEWLNTHKLIYHTIMQFLFHVS